MAAPVRVGTVVNTQQLDKLLAWLSANVQDARPLWHRIDADLSERLERQWTSRGHEFGTPWAPLTPVTKLLRVNRRMTTTRARKKASAAKGVDTPLYDQGRLFASFVKPQSPGAIRVIGPKDYVRGSRYTVGGVPVASIMNEGWRSTHVPVMDEDGEAHFRKRAVPKQIPPRTIIPREMPLPVLSAWEGYIVQYVEQGTVS